MRVTLQLPEPGPHLTSVELSQEFRLVRMQPQFLVSRYSVLGTLTTVGDNGSVVESILVIDSRTGKISVRANAPTQGEFDKQAVK